MRRAVLTLGSTVAGLAALLSLKFHSATSGVPPVAAAGMSSPAASAGGANAAASGAAPATPSATGAPAAGASASSKASASPTAGASSGAAASASHAAASPAHSAAPRQTSPPVATTRTVTGAVENTPYGPMQVQITLTGQKITAVNVLQHTDAGGYSGQLDASAIPQLTSETLSAQSASIDAVSGASYTSSGYIQSLQSALDQARA